MQIGDMDAIDTMQAEAMTGTTETRREKIAAEPLRRCVVSREVLPKETLVRFVVSSAGEVVPDVEGNLPGRGYWVRADASSLQRATEKNIFAKAARRPVQVSADLVERTAALIARRCLDFIGLARRAGQAVCGFQQVRAELQRNGVGVLITATDGADHGHRKLKAWAAEIPEVALFSRADLSAALGRENVVHAAIAPGQLATLFIAESRRLAGIRGTHELNQSVGQ